MRPLQLATACEGPLALNDIAFELCRDFVEPDGARFFRQVSGYADYLAEVLKKPGCRAGDTLKLLLPFLKAHGLTNSGITNFCRSHLMLTPGAEGAYRFLHTQGFPIFAISAGYRQFAEAVGSRLGFDAAHLFCTELDLDRYRLAAAEAAELRRLKQEIAAAPQFELPPGAAGFEDLPEPVRETVQKCDRIFSELIPEMDIGAIYREVNPVGGPEKARALEESLARTGLALGNVIYVGEGSTDVQAFDAVRAGGGLPISFNGDAYGVEAAEVSIIADNAWPIALVASIFRLWGREGVLELAVKGAAGASRYLVLPEKVIEPLARGLHGRNFNLYSATSRKPEAIIQESGAMRARLRAAAVAASG